MTPVSAMSASRMTVAVALMGKAAVVASEKFRRRPPLTEASAAALALSVMSCSGKEMLTGGSPTRTTSVEADASPATAAESTPMSGIGPMLSGDWMRSSGPWWNSRSKVSDI